jgi:hypothetical protein
MYITPRSIAAGLERLLQVSSGLIIVCGSVLVNAPIYHCEGGGIYAVALFLITTL